MESRTSKSLKNARVALFFYLITLALNFISRKVFIDYLGVEILGLNSTAANLLSFLNLAELGIGSAVSYTLYRPLLNEDRQAINEIVSIQGWLYRKIACVVLVGSFLLMFFFPLIFEKADIPIYYAYLSFIVLLLGTLLSYLYNYKQIVLTADQKEYKITQNIQGIKFAKIVLQILAVIYCSNGYFYWLLLELSMSVIGAIMLEYTIKKEYPWLDSTPVKGKLLQKKYPEIIRKTKQIFFHRIAGFAIKRSSPLIIYAYTSLSMVVVYDNYMLIILGVIMLLDASFGSLNSGVGNLVAEGNEEKIKRLFWEITSFRIWVAAVFCFTFYKLGNSFIMLWIGKEYVFSSLDFNLILIFAFISLTRTTEIFISAYGLYQDIGSPIIEALLNLGGSVILGYFYGLTGILFSIIISLVVIVYGWKPYFLYKKGFKCSMNKYVLNQLKYLFLLIISFEFTSWVLERTFFSVSPNDFFSFVQSALPLLGLYIIVSLSFFCLCDSGMRRMLFRIMKIIKNEY